MKRALLTLAATAVVLYAAITVLSSIRPRLPIPYYVVNPDQVPSGSGVLAVILAMAWIADRITAAVHDVRATVRERRARRRRARMLATYRIGSPPVRPDAAVNQAA